MEQEQVSQGPRTMNTQNALIPLRLNAGQTERREGHEPVLCLEFNSLPASCDKIPADPADLVSTVFAFPDATSLLMCVEFMFRAGLVAFGRGPFLAYVQGVAELLAKSEHKPDNPPQGAPA